MSDLPALADARALFSLPDTQSYLNAAYMGAMPRASIAAGEQAYQRRAMPWQVSVEEDFFAVPERVRAAGARLFNARADDIALVTSASYGLAAAARNITLEAGREIVLLAGQFPSNVYIWRELANRTGARIVTVERGQSESWTEAIAPHIGPATGLLACPMVHWIDGGLIDLAALRPALDACGAALVLDLTQSLGALPVDARAVRPDFAVAAAYKWLLGPYQTGLLYVAPGHQGGTPLEENWISRQGASDFARLIDYQDGYEPGARRFDAGERSGFQTLPALLASLDLLNGYGAGAISARLCELTGALASAAAPFGLQPGTADRAAHYLALGLPDTAPSDLLERFRAEGVHLSRRGNSLRISPHIYNHAADIARFERALKAIF
ncbi:MAG: aminotransferase class V-fold PLP-dependent enzyme [Glycocaulis sp.]